MGMCVNIYVCTCVCVCVCVRVSECICVHLCASNVSTAEPSAVMEQEVEQRNCDTGCHYNHGSRQHGVYNLNPTLQ